MDSLSRPRATVVLATLLAWALRLAQLAHQPLWIDEAHSLYFATQSVSTILLRLCDPHPPGYYLLLKSILPLGASEFSLRLPSAAAATLAVPLLFLTARYLSTVLGVARPDRVAALSALLLAVAPLHVWYAQEARMYALVTTLGLGAVFLALRFARRPTLAHALPYALTAAGALFVDQSAALPLLTANLLWGWTWLRGEAAFRSAVTLARWLALQVVAAAPFLIWWSHALYPSIFDARRLYQVAMIVRLLQRLGLDVTWQTVQRVLLAAVVPGAALIAGLYLAALRRRRPLGRTYALALVILFALVTAFSAVPRLFTVKRLLVGLLPYATFAGAWALDRLCPPRRRPAINTDAAPWSPSVPMLCPTLSVVLCAALCVVNAVLVPRGAPWPSVAAWVKTRAAPDDTLWVDDVALPVFDYYFDGPQPLNTLRLADLAAFEPIWTVQEARVWVVALVDPYRNLTDYISPAIQPAQVAAARWPRATVLAYEPARLPDPAPIIQAQPPAWLQAWPSPFDPACAPHR